MDVSEYLRGKAWPALTMFMTGGLPTAAFPEMRSDCRAGVLKFYVVARFYPPSRAVQPLPADRGLTLTRSDEHHPVRR